MIQQFVRKNNMIVLSILLCIGFSIVSPHFLTLYNFSNILAQCALIGFLAVGLTPIVISGNIDLTVGSVVGLTACLVIGLQPSIGLPLAVLCALLAGAGIGLVNGLLVEKIGINSFVVTLAGMIGVRGLAFLYAGESSLAASDGTLTGIAGWSIGPVNFVSLLFLLSVAGFHWVMKNTTHGRNTFAIGGNRNAAVDAGIRVSFHVIINFVLCGTMAAVCGLATAASLSSATPTYGKDYELWAVIAVVLGGTSLRGGKGSVVSTLWAIIALTIMRNGLNLTQISPFFVPAIIGSALIIALIFDRQFGTRPRVGE